MDDTLTPPTAGSNSLADLAVRIRAEHEATVAAIKSGAVHAMACGDLLLEAKARLNRHGAWLPWLKQNCEMSERTAQLYMRMARNREAIEAKSASVADLSLRGAMAVIAPPKPDVDSEEWFEQQLEEPFTDWDFEPGRFGWLQTKIVHCAGLPHAVQFALNAMNEYHVHALAMCTNEEMSEALELMIPLALNGASSSVCKFDVSNPLRAYTTHKMFSMAIYVVLRDEFTDRQKLSDDHLEKRAKETSKALLAAIRAKEAKLTELMTRPISDEAKFEAVLALT